tara:strand:- start:198 stop:386 length:189 start_codon:yes stop_codon:yes gene_type:complete
LGKDNHKVKKETLTMTLEERMAQLKEQQRQAEVNFHQITGAIAVLEQQIADEKEPKKDDKKK